MSNLTPLKDPRSIPSISPRLRIILIAFVIIIASVHTFFQFQYDAQASQIQTYDPEDLSGESTYLPPSNSKDAYITFLSSADDPWFFTSVRLLLFQLKYDPLTRDPSNRDVIVLTTPQIPLEMEDQLRSEGAVIYRHDLIDGLPMGRSNDGFYNETNHGYKDQYTKLAIFNMTQWDRLMYLDSDQLLALPIHELWNDPKANPEHGLAGFFDPGMADHTVPIGDGDLLNAGFLLVKPSTSLFEELLLVRNYDETMMEQNLLNEYFRRDGPHPWLPLNHIYTAVHPRKYDLEGGVHVLHEKLWKSWTWQGEVHRELTELFRQKLGRMGGYWLGKERAKRDMEIELAGSRWW